MQKLWYRIVVITVPDVSLSFYPYLASSFVFLFMELLEKQLHLYLGSYLL
ncbi:hypothetical protein ACH8ZP_00850 [Chlamydia pneumoniae]|uniref:Uncharacterized protein n=1 Tax=Chlamydia pneumoniae TaxID=83558 RepID=A0A0F7XB84_CHLPN|nr:hypothetical protein [Chlamydia pneumoniae]CRI32672.1 hypothetical protein BN1224_Wien1_A_01790 [Chlamydia pneumoniae]CRI35533.1 hypothetical protein BN1224_CM1_A_01800 [Chlamydia pneumoniae]CRI36660.1 hypothetical protein BN1224_CV14_A_01790 [Chlamydia pneumoniae]CRI37785.1 hypothetical protein BN1224_CV15_B_01080 [Chlamydia pneumoniae]CRI38918.1 hypothetical protein BN1224_CWL011_A_01820 [Chlamydia pneumoniae]